MAVPSGSGGLGGLFATSPVAPEPPLEDDDNRVGGDDEGDTVIPCEKDDGCEKPDEITQPPLNPRCSPPWPA
ncbi:MAG: hypothetical protein P8N02_12250 [Actinomycetota bacterium]|nr:hypothetical protein [Actinomycetota bacterium]